MRKKIERFFGTPFLRGAQARDPAPNVDNADSPVKPKVSSKVSCHFPFS